MILIAALALSSTAPAHAQQGKLEEAVMALPVASLSFSMTYLADDLNSGKSTASRSRPWRFPASAR
jgi:hypothetical protein